MSLICQSNFNVHSNYFNIFIPVCTILCSIIFDLVKKHLPQSTHLNGLSPKISMNKIQIKKQKFIHKKKITAKQF